MQESTWLLAAEQEIERSVPTLCPGCSRAVALRLAKLFLQRIGDPLSAELMGLLPAGEHPLVAPGPGERSIGLPDFVSHAGFVLGLHEPELPSDEHENRLRRIVLAFFRGTTEALPESLRYRVKAALPAEIRYAGAGTMAA